MKVQPISPVFRSFDDHDDAEEKRWYLFLRLVDGMTLPYNLLSQLESINTRKDALKWMDKNLHLQNNHHPNFRRVRNILKLLLRTKDGK